MAGRYVVLARDAGNWEELGVTEPAEFEEIVGRYIAWTDRLAGAGRLVISEKLVDGTGRVLRRRAGRMSVTDGPLAETKEVIGGFWILEAASLDEAERTCADHPHLEFGSLEIREVQELS